VQNLGDHGVKELWLGVLVEGAVGELARTNHTTLARVLGAEVVTRSGSGRRETTPLGMGEAPVGRQFHSSSDADLRQRALDAAHEYGLTLDSVEVLHPLDSALAVTFTVPPGGVSWTLTELDDALLGSPVDLEGLFVQLNSPSGRPLLIVENGQRIRGGGGWSAHGQDGRFGVVHG
jgi:hypothetical protein